MMHTKRPQNVIQVGRRTFLKGLGSSLIGLPFLAGMQSSTALAQTSANPKRLIVISHPQGSLLDQWRPNNVGALGTLSPLLRPLESVKQHMLVLSGVSNIARRSHFNSNGHIPAGHSIFSATPMAGSFFSDGTLRPREDHPRIDVSYGPSFDQVIAQRLKTATQRQSVNLGIHRHSHENRLFWRGTPGNTELVSSESNPVEAYKSLFGNVSFPDEDPKPLTRQERFRAHSSSVLDRVASSYTALQKSLPVEDREVLANHAKNVQELEKNLQVQVNIEGACAKLNMQFPMEYDSRQGRWADVSAKNQIDILTMSLACGVSQVATLQFGEGHAPRFSYLNNYTIPLPGYKNWHDMIHKQGDQVSREGLFRGFEWYSSKVAYLIEKLATTPEGDGTLLDNTLVVWTSEFGNGGRHSTTNLPLVLFGNLGGTIKTGQHLAVQDRTTNELFVTLLQAFGGTDKNFGLVTSHDGETLMKQPLDEIMV